MSELERHETIGNEIFERLNAVRDKDRADALETVNRLRRSEEVADVELADALFYFSSHLDIFNPFLPVCSELLERFLRLAEIKETPRGLTLAMLEEVKREAEEDDNKGRWWGRQFCPHPGGPCIDGCYYCGREVKNDSGDHNHTKVSMGGAEEFSCVCETC